MIFVVLVKVYEYVVFNLNYMCSSPADICKSITISNVVDSDTPQPPTPVEHDTPHQL